MKNNFRKVGEMEFDGLITDTVPPVQVRGGTIAALSGAADYKRGTIFAKSSADSKLYILGTAAESGDTLTPDCILCDDTTVDGADAVVTVYTAGCFNPDKTAVAESYIISEADKDKLRERDIVFRAASFAN